MVTFELLIQNQEELVYWYYPEGNKDKRYGVIKVDLIKESITRFAVIIISVRNLLKIKVRKL